MIILPNEKSVVTQNAVHPLVPELIVDLAEKDDNGTIVNVIPKKSLFDHPAAKLYPMFTYTKNNDYHWLSIVERPVEGKVVVRFTCSTPGKGAWFDCSPEGRIMRWFGEFIYEYLLRTPNIDIRPYGLFQCDDRYLLNLKTLSPFFEVIEEYVTERGIIVPVFNTDNLSPGQQLKPKITEQYHALFGGIKARVSMRAEIDYVFDQTKWLNSSGSFKPARYFTVTPALDLSQYDERYAFTITEEGFSNVALYPKNQAIVEAWLKAIVTGM